ncbi:DUF4857 domain-containing protein [Thiocapsa rosea]|uniref:Uncharacterized protein DUF4857 n=1 Tax=Thiocapsa rosea TaxID=69360 RepID=A0A495V9C5_9GAMM|nr:DUF4857 domain-containing protein [Thiocapsa rosea]RKT44967.1 uncharacterized protein DUF4857 [Thiocapsa rosea]
MMTARVARWSLMLLTVFLLAVWLPLAKDLLFPHRYGKTALFYSPVIERFVYTELIGEGHQFVYRDQDGKDYAREEFESLLPFIYYKNMELWGKLPLTLAGRSFDKAAIQAERQVLELTPAELPGHAPRIPLFPLLESAPGRAGLTFPEDILRAGERLTFIGSDANRLDPALTDLFTTALADAGFAFPVRAIFGRVSILKPFDAGLFLLDADGALFRLRRVRGEPAVDPVALPDGLAVRHLKVAENKRGEHLGLLLGEDGRLFLLGQTDFRLTPLDLPGYDPDRMALKVLFDPLHRTAVYSDDVQIKSVVMDPAFQPIDLYEREMGMAVSRPIDRFWRAFVPFGIDLHDPNRRDLTLDLHLHGPTALLGIAAAMWIAIRLVRRRGPTRPGMLPALALVAFTGFYGLLALALFPPAEPSPENK